MKVSELNKIKLLILSSRPGMGKTTFAVNIIKDIAINKKLPTLFFSLEMSKETAAKRIMCNETESQKSKTAISTNIYIEDTPNISIEDISKITKALKEEKDIRLVIIDYLQLICNYSKEEKSKILCTLQTLSTELNIPILAVSQLANL